MVSWIFSTFLIHEIIESWCIGCNIASILWLPFFSSLLPMVFFCTVAYCKAAPNLSVNKCIHRILHTVCATFIIIAEVLLHHPSRVIYNLRQGNIWVCIASCCIGCNPAWPYLLPFLFMSMVYFVHRCKSLYKLMYLPFCWNGVRYQYYVNVYILFLSPSLLQFNGFEHSRDSVSTHLYTALN